MKKLLLLILTPVIIVVGIPLATFAIMYDGQTVNDMPVHLYTEDADPMGILSRDLNDAIDAVRTDTSQDLLITVHQDVINMAIYTMIVGDDEVEGINPNYRPDDQCQSAECMYIFEEVIQVGDMDVNLRFIGMWVTFSEERLTLNTSVEIDLGSFAYKTTVRTNMIIQDNEEDYNVEFAGFNIGNLPLPKGMFSFFLNAAFTIADLDLSELSEDIPGTLDVPNLKYNLPKSEVREIIESSSEDATGILLGELIDVIYQNRLVTFALEEDRFVLNFAVSLLRNEDNVDIPPYLLALLDSDGTFDPDSFNVELYMRNRFQEFIFNQALTGQQQFNLSQNALNRIVFSTAEGFVETQYDFTYTNPNGDEETIILGIRGLWFELGENHINVYALVVLDTIRMQMKITATETAGQPNEIVYELTRISIGEDPGETEDQFILITELDGFKSALATLGDFGFGGFNNAGQFVINTEALSDFFDDGTVEGNIQVSDFNVIDGAISMTIIAPSNLQDVLDSYTEALKDVFVEEDIQSNLNSALNPTPGSSEEAAIQTAVAIQDKLINNEPITSEDISDLFEAFEAMDQTNQDVFLDVFESLLDPSIFEQFSENFQ